MVLRKRDDKLVPVFWRALAETGQKHVAVMLGYEGLYVVVLLLIYFISLS